MNAEITVTEIDMVRAYQGTPDATDKAAMIMRYAEFMHLSPGRAEDQLDLWAYLLRRPEIADRPS